MDNLIIKLAEDITISINKKLIECMDKVAGVNPVKKKLWTAILPDVRNIIGGKLNKGKKLISPQVSFNKANRANSLIRQLDIDPGKIVHDKARTGIVSTNMHRSPKGPTLNEEAIGKSIDKDVALTKNFTLDELASQNPESLTEGMKEVGGGIFSDMQGSGGGFKSIMKNIESNPNLLKIIKSTNAESRPEMERILLSALEDIRIGGAAFNRHGKALGKASKTNSHLDRIILPHSSDINSDFMTNVMRALKGGAVNEGRSATKIQSVIQELMDTTDVLKGQKSLDKLNKLLVEYKVGNSELRQIAKHFDDIELSRRASLDSARRLKNRYNLGDRDVSTNSFILSGDSFKELEPTFLGQLYSSLYKTGLTDTDSDGVVRRMLSIMPFGV